MEPTPAPTVHARTGPPATRRRTGVGHVVVRLAVAAGIATIVAAQLAMPALAANPHPAPEPGSVENSAGRKRPDPPETPAPKPPPRSEAGSTRATPAIPATPAVPASSGLPAIAATPATRAIPASAAGPVRPPAGSPDDAPGMAPGTVARGRAVPGASSAPGSADPDGTATSVARSPSPPTKSADPDAGEAPATGARDPRAVVSTEGEVPDEEALVLASIGGGFGLLAGGAILLAVRRRSSTAEREPAGGPILADRDVESLLAAALEPRAAPRPQSVPVWVRRLDPALPHQVLGVDVEADAFPVPEPAEPSTAPDEPEDDLRR